MRLAQFIDPTGNRAAAAIEGDTVWTLPGTTFELAWAALAAGVSLEEWVRGRPTLDEGPYPAFFAREGLRFLPPLDHPDPAHLLLSGTGLTHLGSAAARDRMHQKAEAPAEQDATDTMRMFRLGMEGGKPHPGTAGVQPEWFYKGNGHHLTAPGEALPVPAFAEDGGEEPEIAGIYVIGPDGTPHRVGFSLANEFSDHVMERRNYLYLAHSKLRRASCGPELRLGTLPDAVVGTSRIWRDEKILFEREFLSGEAHMCHSLENLEYHHFKYDLFRYPGDVHIHFFGTGTLSFGEGVRTQPGDVFEMVAADFGLPLRNVVGTAPATVSPGMVATL